MPDVPIRDAASVVILRGERVLMGQRNANAGFMPSKFVFPGGAVDPQDAAIACDGLSEGCKSRLNKDSQVDAATLAVTAIRELWEETGQILGAPAVWDDAPAGWHAFAQAGFRPDASALRFFFRAVTPKERPKRFDARFFLTTSDALCSDPDDFTQASGELTHLQWIPVAQAATLPLAFITHVILAEVIGYLQTKSWPEAAPYFRNDQASHAVSWLR
jgi:8-oxo-dGTP pyrophosphatase MutT (NUDIX family)